MLYMHTTDADARFDSRHENFATNLFRLLSGAVVQANIASTLRR